MTKKTVSMRGEEVDFDLMEIKAKMQKMDKPLDVKTREDFVHMKRRRRGGAKIEQLLKSRQDASDEEAKTSATSDTEPTKAKASKKKATKKSDIKASAEPEVTPEVTPEQEPEVTKEAKRKIIKKDS